MTEKALGSAAGADPVAHTNGPWRITGQGTIRAGDDRVAQVYWHNKEANARLIAAAPNLLAALRGQLTLLEHYASRLHNVHRLMAREMKMDMALLRSVISRATEK